MALDAYRTQPGLPPSLDRSPAESNRFGFEMGRLELATAAGIDPADLRELFLRSPLELLVLRVPAECFDWSAHLRHYDLAVLTCDSLLYFRKDLAAMPARERVTTTRVATAADADLLARTVTSTFADYPNHYAADPVIDRMAARDGYVEWALSYLCDPVEQRCVLFFESAAGALTSWATVRNGRQGEIVLGGVLPEHRGRGAYAELLAGAEEFLAAHGVTDCVISTQPTNRTVIRAWIRSGYQFDAAFTTMHLLKGRALDMLAASEQGVTVAASPV